MKFVHHVVKCNTFYILGVKLKKHLQLKHTFTGTLALCLQTPTSTTYSDILGVLVTKYRFSPSQKA